MAVFIDEFFFAFLGHKNFQCMAYGFHFDGVRHGQIVAIAVEWRVGRQCNRNALALKGFDVFFEVVDVLCEQAHQQAQGSPYAKRSYDGNVEQTIAKVGFRSNIGIEPELAYVGAVYYKYVARFGVSVVFERAFQRFVAKKFAHAQRYVHPQPAFGTLRYFVTDQSVEAGAAGAEKRHTIGAAVVDGECVVFFDALQRIERQQGRYA